MRSLPQLLLGLAATAVAIVVTGFVVADAVRDVKRSRDTIEVTGSAKQPITADLVKWTLSVSAQDQDPAAASRVLRSHVGRVRAFLREGVRATALDPAPISTELVEQTLPGRRRVTAYRLTQSFEVSAREIDRVEAAATRLSELLDAGVPISALPLEYISTQLTEAR